MIESCSKIEAGDWNEARKATWRLRMRVASRTKRFGKPSLNFLMKDLVWGAREREREDERERESSEDGGKGRGGREKED